MQEKSVRYVLWFWGMDRKGDQVNLLLTFGTLQGGSLCCRKSSLRAQPTGALLHCINKG